MPSVEMSAASAPRSSTMQGSARTWYLSRRCLGLVISSTMQGGVRAGSGQGQGRDRAGTGQGQGSSGFSSSSRRQLAIPLELRWPLSISLLASD